MYNVLAKKAQTVHTAVDHRLLTGVRRGEGERERERGVQGMDRVLTRNVLYRQLRTPTY